MSPSTRRRFARSTLRLFDISQLAGPGTEEQQELEGGNLVEIHFRFLFTADMEIKWQRQFCSSSSVEIPPPLQANILRCTKQRRSSFMAPAPAPQQLHRMLGHQLDGASLSVPPSASLTSIHSHGTDFQLFVLHRSTRGCADSILI